MTRMFRNAGVRARLLALMALLMVPVALGGVWFARIVRDSALDSIETAREHIINDYNNRARLVLRAAARTAYATTATAWRAGDPALCAAALRAALGTTPSWVAIRISTGAGSECSAAVDASDAVATGAPLTGTNVDRIGASGEAAIARYSAQEIGGRSRLVVQIDIPSSGDKPDRLELLVDANALANSFEFGDLEDANVAIVSPQGRLVALRSGAKFGDDWLPAAAQPAKGYARFAADAAGGGKGEYAVAPVAFSDLAIVGRFSDIATEQARRSFIAMAVAPVGVALALFLLFAIMLQHDVIRWIDDIRGVARAHLDNPSSPVRAPVSDAMPRELRNVATALNTMLADVHAREQELEGSVAENRRLMRELHHRVKNSLQVIQSYLSLSRREAEADARGELGETETRVLVLSVAYRLALSDGGMRPVAMRQFAEEIVGHLAATMRGDDQWISLDADIDASLVVDRAIPLGLAMVEVAMSSLSAPGCTRVAVRLWAPERELYELAISADGPPAAAAPRRIMQGLALQLQAEAMPTIGDERLRWRFSA